MSQRLEDIESGAAAAIAACPDMAGLEELRVRYLGRKGAITELLKSVAQLPAAERPAFGAAANQLRDRLTVMLDGRAAALSQTESAQALARERIDVSLPGRAPWLGHRHPLSQLLAEITDIFHGLGFTVAGGPDVDTVYYNFDALNASADHPSRSPQDTFYIKNAPDQLLRTQTSTVQIRVMEKQPPPVRIIAPGRCYRRDAIDASHMPVFYQVEGLYVDKGVTMADLKATLSYFAWELMGEKVKLRFRPHFFPFTEPSVEFDFSCVFCQGKGCRVCKQSGWLEIGGAGMVDPNVFKTVGYDPDVYSGFAWGHGVERVAMLKYGINDIRLFYSGDIRFLEQF